MNTGTSFAILVLSDDTKLEMFNLKAMKRVIDGYNGTKLTSYLIPWTDQTEGPIKALARHTGQKYVTFVDSNRFTTLWHVDAELNEPIGMFQVYGSEMPKGDYILDGQTYYVVQ